MSEALVAAGVTVKRPGIDIPFGTQDDVWLAIAGALGWIVLSRDQRVRHRALEIYSLREAQVGAFVLTAGQATAQATAEVVIAKLSKMVNISRSERRPFLYTLGITGVLSKVKLR